MKIDVFIATPNGMICAFDERSNFKYLIKKK